MAFCWHCGLNLPDEAKYCRLCGEKQEKHPSVSPLPLKKVTPHPSERKNAPQPPMQPTKQSTDKKIPLSVEIASPHQPLSHQDGPILLSLQVSHRGSGAVRNISIIIRGLQGEQKALEAKWLSSLKQGEIRIVNIPVTLIPTPNQEWLECRADLVYHWNNEKRSSSYPLKVQLRHLNPVTHTQQENHQSEVRKRIGLFIDYENGSPLGCQSEEQKVGEALISYASRFGEVVCRWVIADPRNRRDWADAETRLKQVGFEVRKPSSELSASKAPKNAADEALRAQIDDELDRTKPDTYIIVSGDGDYHEKILDLIGKGKTVRLWAPLRHRRVSEKYFKLERERHLRDFFIDDLNTILQFPEK